MNERMAERTNGQLRGGCCISRVGIVNSQRKAQQEQGVEITAWDAALINRMTWHDMA